MGVLWCCFPDYDSLGHTSDHPTHAGPSNSAVEEKEWIRNEVSSDDFLGIIGRTREGIPIKLM